MKKNLWKIETKWEVKGFWYNLEDQADNITVRSSEIDEFDEKKDKTYSNTIHLNLSPSDDTDEEIEIVEEEIKSEDISAI